MNEHVQNKQNQIQRTQPLIQWKKVGVREGDSRNGVQRSLISIVMENECISPSGKFSGMRKSRYLISESSPTIRGFQGLLESNYCNVPKELM